MVIETIVSAQDVCAWFDTKLLLKKLKKKHSSVEFETECELDVFPELLQWNASGTLLYLEDVLGNWRILKTKVKDFKFSVFWMSLLLLAEANIQIIV